MTISVMLVDDSSTVRGLLARALEQDSEIKIIANASDGKIAVEMTKTLRPDIIILDIEMPNMDGITAIPLLLEAAPNTHIIMASKLTRKSAFISLKALELGASDYVAKPEIDELDDFYRDLSSKIKALAASRKASVASVAATPQTSQAVAKDVAPKLQTDTTVSTVRALAIASSTGGPQALLALFSGMKGKPLHVPVFITQHMPAVFTAVLAEHIATASGFPCTEGKDGEIVQPGHIYIAPGDHHMLIKREGTNAVIRINQDPHVNYCRPAADPMFQSISETYGKHVFAVVLTGMGRDGAEGAQTIVKNGGRVIAQDEKTSVVYGMPKAVADKGICQAILPLPEISGFLLKNC